MKNKKIPDHILKDMLSYDASLFSGNSLVDYLEKSLSFVRNEKASLIRSEIASFVQTLPSEEKALTLVAQKLAYEIVSARSSEYISTIKWLHGYTEAKIKMCLKQGNQHSANMLISTNPNSNPKCITEKCK